MHRRFPYAVVAGFLFLDKDARHDDTEKRKSTFENAFPRLRLFTGRIDPAGRDEQFERLYLLLADANPFQPSRECYQVNDAIEELSSTRCWTISSPLSPNATSTSTRRGTGQCAVPEREDVFDSFEEAIREGLQDNPWQLDPGTGAMTYLPDHALLETLIGIPVGEASPRSIGDGKGHRHGRRT